MEGPRSSVSSVAELAEATRELEARIPAAKGAFPDFFAEYEACVRRASEATLYVMGAIKAGKSTLLDSLVERDLLPRGSGVKTFSLARLKNGPSDEAVIRFHESARLGERLRFDGRLLGCEFEPPGDFYSSEAAGELAQIQARVEAFLRDEGRLARVQDQSSEDNLPALAWTRLQKVCAGISQIYERFGASALRQLSHDGRLVFSGARFDEVTQWMESSDVASLIREVEFTVPFPGTLPGGIELVDCQGSDSLNPLDIQAIDSVLHETDGICYVIHSRFGLREADRALIRRLRRAAARELMFAVNVEAFDPVDDGTLTQIDAQIRAEIGEEPKIFHVISLVDLLESTGDSETVAMSRNLWSRAGREERWTALRENRRQFDEQLAAFTGRGREKGGEVFPVLVHKASATAKALLNRDEALYGIGSQSTDSKGLREILHRIFAGEKDAAKQDVARLVDDAFASDGELVRRLEDFWKTARKGGDEALAMPENTDPGDDPTGLITAATDAFNARLLAVENELQQEFMNPAIERAKAQIQERLARAERMALDALPSALTGLSSAGEGAFSSSPLEQELLTLPRPRLFEPAVIPAAVRHSLVAEYHSRRWLMELRERLFSSSPQRSPRSKAKRLWKRAIGAALRQARGNAEFSVSSARENFKYRYTYAVCERLFQKTEEALDQKASAHAEALQSLSASDQLVLDSEARRHLKSYLSRLSN